MDSQKPAITKERLQNKADILESNLFNAVSKNDDKINFNLQINREQFPDSVILKALLQLFPRFSIKGSQIVLNLNKMLTRKIPEGNQVKLEKQLLSLDETEDTELSRLSVTLEIILSHKLLHLSIKGTPEIPSQDGSITKSFFDSESCPGIIKKGGDIDFREINKFPIVKAGDELFFITTAVQGKPGMQYDGKIIPVPKALPLELNLNGGVDRLYKDETKIGYLLTANKTGVVLLSRDHNIITDIEISDQLNIKRLDYSTGNIGTKFVCPISMKIDTICSEFKIRAMGMVEANIMEGGEIETDDQAKLHIIMPDSKVTAQKDITLHFARNATLTSKTGTITILDELVDSTLFAPTISFEKTKGIMTTNTLDAETICLKNIYFGGDNIVYFGRKLFSERHTLIESLTNLEKESLALGEEEKEGMENFHRELKRLTNAIKKNPQLLDNMKNLILATRTMDFETLDTELAAIEKLMNTKEVSIMKKRLETLKIIPKKNKEFKAMAKELTKKIEEAELKMSTMSLTIEGLLRRAATIKLYTGTEEEDFPQKPQLLIESETSEDTFVKIACTYNDRGGFKIVQN
ncbi:MAG: DUF342 domain-containing protein [Desulfobacteraceae bacterium]|nr:DUF342 domain-containing protein [Desulfobacteraceae bacterium]